MLRLACGIAIIAFIFAHSPERPKEGVSEDAARWLARTHTEITEAALRSDAARGLVHRSLASAEGPATKPAR